MKKMESSRRAQRALHAHGRGFEKDQQCAHAGHYHFRQRHGHRRARAASLERLAPDPKNIILLAGFQAEGTRGRALEVGAKTIRIHGQDIPVAAEVINLRQFSAHAGKSELLRWLTGVPSPPRQIYLTHGEPPASAALKTAIESAFRWRVALPQYLQTVDLDTQYNSPTCPGRGKVC